MRTPTKWREHQTQVKIEDHATALAYLSWRIALGKAKQLHVDDYIYSADEQRTGVIREYLCFLVHISDRLVFPSLNADERQRFVGTLGRETARHYQRNLEDVFGRNKNYSEDYISTLNARISEYAEYQFDDGAPGYQMLRALGHRILDLMGEDQTNRWVIDQTMDIDAPAAVEELKRGLDNLFGSATALSLPAGWQSSPE